MPYKDEVTGDWHCKYCDASYYNELSAIGCEHNHEIVYIPMFREDLQRLLQFLYLKDESLLTERLITTLRKYTIKIKGSQE